MKPQNEVVKPEAQQETSLEDELLELTLDELEKIAGGYSGFAPGSASW